MSKKNKNLQKQVLISQTEEEKDAVVVTDEGASSAPENHQVEQVKEVKEDKTDKKPAKEDKNAKGKKEKKPKEKKFRKKVRETVSELKKVTWPSFGEVCKKTGIVLSVVVIFGIVLFGLDVGLYYLFGLLT